MLGASNVAEDAESVKVDEDYGFSAIGFALGRNAFLTVHGQLDAAGRR